MGAIGLVWLHCPPTGLMRPSGVGADAHGRDRPSCVEAAWRPAL